MTSIISTFSNKMAFLKPNYNKVFQHESGGNLYIGNWDSSFDTHLLTIIDGAINCTTVKSGTFSDLNPNYLVIPMGNEKGLEKYYNSFSFLEERLSKGLNILVFCAVGITRSVAIIISYLILRKKYTFEKAFQLLKQIRPTIIDDNPFKSELLELQKKILQ